LFFHTCGAFTIYFSTPTLTRNSNEHPIVFDTFWRPF
jgi:hypothetical protein